MTDPTTFEARLTAALDRYADRMLVDVDASQLTRDLARAQPAVAAGSRRWSIAGPTIRLALLLALVLAIVAGSLLVAGFLIRKTWPVAINGPMLLTRHGDPNRLELVAIDGSSLGTVDVGSPLQCPHLLPGGKRVAYWTVDGRLETVAIDGGSPTILDWTPFRDTPEDGSSWDGGVWSADGGRVAFVTDGVRVIDTSKGTIRQIPLDGVVGMTWAPSGDLTIARQLSGEVQVSNVGADDAIGPEIVRYAWDAVTMGPPKFGWSPDGTQLAYLANGSSYGALTGSSDLVIIKTQDGSRSTVAGGVDYAFDPASIFSPDGTRIAVATGHGFVVTDLDGANAVTIEPIDAAPWSLVGWSPDGTWIALAAGGRHVAVHPDGTGQVRLATRLSGRAADRSGGVPAQLTWAPDSSMLAFTSEGYGPHSVSTFPVDGTAGRTIAEFEANGGGKTCFYWPAGGEVSR